MPFNSQGLSAREIRMVQKLVDASGLLDCIYWRQSDPEGLKLYLSLAKSNDPQDELLRRYLKINGSRFDLIDDDKPFVGTQPMPPGRGFFPQDMTKEKFDAYVGAHPQQKTALYSPYTVVRDKPHTADDSDLVAIPYHVAYREFLEPMAQDLRDAASAQRRSCIREIPSSPRRRTSHRRLLRKRHRLARSRKSKIRHGLRPLRDLRRFAARRENHLRRLGHDSQRRRKRQKLALYQKYVPDLQEALPLPAADLPSQRGQHAPMEVVDSPYRAGDLLHGYQAVADNLPNDPRIHEEKGSKKMFWKNFMDARVNYIILPLAQRVMRADQAAMASGEGYMADTIMHEISHGLGPAFARTAQGKVPINEAIGSAYSALEESKADVVGEFCYGWLIDHGAVPKEKRNTTYASYVAGIFRTVRFGIAEAHGQGEMMQFNYYTEQGAIRRDPATGLYEIDFEKMPGAIASLAKELLEQEATGDRARTEAWFKKYGQMPPELSAAASKNHRHPGRPRPRIRLPPGAAMNIGKGPMR